MTLIDDLLAANEGAPRPALLDQRPTRRLAIVTCMDARIDVFAVLGLELGDAHVIRNAGGRLTDDVLRSLALSSGMLGVDTVVVMQHTRCGLAGASDAELRARTGADLDFLPIADHEASLARTSTASRARPIFRLCALSAGSSTTSTAGGSKMLSAGSDPAERVAPNPGCRVSRPSTSPSAPRPTATGQAAAPFYLPTGVHDDAR